MGEFRDQMIIAKYKAIKKDINDPNMHIILDYINYLERRIKNLEDIIHLTRRR